MNANPEPPESPVRVHSRLSSRVVRQLRAILASTAAATSLLLFITTVNFWARGYTHFDEAAWHRFENHGRDYYAWYLFLESGQGGLAVRLDAEIYDRASITAAQAARPTDRWEPMPISRAAIPTPPYPEPFSKHAVVCSRAGF